VERGGPRLKLSTPHPRDDGSSGAVERTKTNPEGRLLTRPQKGTAPPIRGASKCSGPANAALSFREGSNESGQSQPHQSGPVNPRQSVRAGTLNRCLSPTLKERLRERGAPIGYGDFPKN